MTDLTQLAVALEYPPVSVHPVLSRAGGHESAWRKPDLFFDRLLERSPCADELGRRMSAPIDIDRPPAVLAWGGGYHLPGWMTLPGVGAPGRLEGL